MQSCLSTDEANTLDNNLKDAINNLNRFNYAYTPAPIPPFPGTIQDINKFVTITPIGTYAPNDSGSNPITDFMMKLPDKQTPETCISNAAMLKSRTLSNTPFNNPPVVGTQKNITRNITSQQLIRDSKEIVTQERKTEKQTLYKNVARTGTQTVTKLTKVYINGLHFRATRDGSGYMGDNPNYFNQNPGIIEIDTSKIQLYTDDIYLPTNFSSLQTSTTTNATADKSVYTIYNNVNRTDSKPERHFFAVEWSGLFKPNMTGQWVFTTNSDDVSFLWVESDNIRYDNGVYTPDNAIVDNRGLHGMQLKSSDDKNIVLNMTSGLFYRIKIQFSENGGGYDMIVTARCKNGGPTITDFTGFFYAEVPKMVTSQQSYNYIEYNVPYQADVVVTRPVKTTEVSYKEGGVETTTVSMGDMFNPTYSINDVNAVYVSMVKDPTITNSSAKYDCYVSNPSTVAQLNTVFNQSNDTTPIFNIIDIWQSNPQGNVNDNTGYCNLDKNGNLFLDNTTTINIKNSSITNVRVGNVRDEIPYMYISETIRENAVIPSIVIYQKSTGLTRKVDISTDKTFTDIMDMCKSGEITQISNKLWINQESNILAYNEKNEADKPTMGIIYKITNQKGLISNNQMFRLILKNGRLTLQMCITITKSLDNHSKYKYTKDIIINSSDGSQKKLTSNTLALLKIDVDHRLNSVNLIDNATTKSYYVDDKYTVYSNTYSTYENTFPSKSQVNEGYAANKTICKRDCNASKECRAYYSYTKGSKEMCTLIGGTEGSTDVNNFPDIKHPQLFNPVPFDQDITTSSLSIKNKIIDPSYISIPNSTYKINNKILSTGNSNIEQPRKYYPDQKYNNTNQNCTPNVDGTLDCDPTLDLLKKVVDIRVKEKDLALNTSDCSTVRERINEYNYMIDTGKIVYSSENFTNLREAYTQLNAINSKCSTDSIKNGLCDIATKLNDINKLQDDVNKTSEILIVNKGIIANKVTDVDTKFQGLSNNISDNYYKNDFNDYDDTPDTSMLGAMERDTNILLLHENTIYMVGTIITASLAILGIILAKS